VVRQAIQLNYFLLRRLSKWCETVTTSRVRETDGISFDFIKKLWELLKDDFMQFLVDFHRNDNLTKGVNSTFTALIPEDKQSSTS